MAAAVADRRVVHERTQRTAVNGIGVVHGSNNEREGKFLGLT